MKKIEVYEIDGVLYRENQIPEYIEMKANSSLEAEIESLSEYVCAMIRIKYDMDIDRDTVDSIVEDTSYELIEVIIQNFDKLIEISKSTKEKILKEISLCDKGVSK